MNAEFIYNPQGFSGHGHSSCLAEHNGKIYCAWYAYEEKEHERGQICISSKALGENEWPKGQFIFKNLEGSSCGNPVIFSHNGTLHIYFVILKRSYWDSAIIYYAHLQEDQTWSSPCVVNSSFPGLMVRHRPYINGPHIYVPAYDENTMSTIIYRASEDLGNWEEFSRVDGEYIQGDILSFDNRQWQMYLRAAGDNEHVIKILSPDSGKTWTKPITTALPCPLSGIAAIKLSSGNLIVSNNHTEEHKRNPISISLSKNMGVNFEPTPWHVDKLDMELSYPTLLQDSTGLIHLAYTYNRKMIKCISMTEDEIIENTGGSSC